MRVDASGVSSRLIDCFVLVLVISGGTLAKPTIRNSHELDQLWVQYRAEASQQQPAMQFPHQACFAKAAEKYDLPITLLLAVARGESDFDARATSSANALGVMQILWPATAEYLGLHNKESLFEPCTNIDAGARYLKELLTRYEGNIHRTLAAYNYGPGRVAVGNDAIPEGAVWYSGYIYRHLQYVLASSTSPGNEADYNRIYKRTLITFSRPYRAAAYVKALEQVLPEDKVDWFRRGESQYRVRLLYLDSTEAHAMLRRARDAGYL